MTITGTQELEIIETLDVENGKPIYKPPPAGKTQWLNICMFTGVHAYKKDQVCGKYRQHG